MSISHNSVCNRTALIWTLSVSTSNHKPAVHIFLLLHLLLVSYTWEPHCRKLASSFPSITDFEVCALANLAPGDAEEAKLMIPSLAVRNLSEKAYMPQYGSR